MRNTNKSDSGSTVRSFEELDVIREQQGLTRKQVYEAAGVDKETWRRTFKGKTLPNSRTLKKLNDALDWLMAREKAPL